MKGMSTVSLLLGVLLITGLVLGGIGAYQYYRNAELGEERITVYEKLISDQKQTISRLEGKIRKLEQQVRERPRGTTTESGEQSRETAVARGLYEQHKQIYDDPNIFFGKVTVAGGVMKCFFTSGITAEAWLQTNPSFFARQDLDYFLKSTGKKRGTVDYFISPEKKIFSISGSSESASTRKY